MSFFIEHIVIPAVIPAMGVSIIHIVCLLTRIAAVLDKNRQRQYGE